MKAIPAKYCEWCEEKLAHKTYDPYCSWWCYSRAKDKK